MRVTASRALPAPRTSRHEFYFHRSPRRLPTASRSRRANNTLHACVETRPEQPRVFDRLGEREPGLLAAHWISLQHAGEEMLQLIVANRRGQLERQLAGLRVRLSLPGTIYCLRRDLPRMHIRRTRFERLDVRTASRTQPAPSFRLPRAALAARSM